MARIQRLAGLLLLLLCLQGSFSPVQAAGLQDTDIDYIGEWEVQAGSDGGTLLLSDSPEMVSQDGILYQDKVDGTVRLFYYHVNEAPTAKRLDVILENDGPEPAHIKVQKYGRSDPGFSWMTVGKETLRAYLTGSQPYELTIPPRQSRSLSPDIHQTAILTNMLAHGIYDFVTDKPVTVRVLMMPLLADSDRFYPTAKILPADSVHLRGTFAGANRMIVPLQPYNPTTDGAIAITLADNQWDRYVRGTDATDGSSVVNYGNYGIVYQIPFPSKTGSAFSAYLAPRGGEYAGAVGIQSPDVYWSPVATPRGRLSYGLDARRDFTFLGNFDGGVPLAFTFSPPGGSNLPVRLVFLPQS